MARKESSPFIPLLSIFAILFSIIAVSVAIKKPQIFSPEADTGVELHVRLSKSYIAPGESYIFQAIQRNNAGTPYSGYLDVKSTVCNSSGTNCSTSTGTWKNFDGSSIWVNSGAFTVNVPSNFPSVVIKAQWKPKDSTVWSNEAKLNVGTTWGLKDTTKFWVFFTSKKEFKGVNRVFNQNFTTNIWHSGSQSICGLTGRIMYFQKSNVYGYWEPRMPWYNRSYDRNLSFYLQNWRRPSGWHDNYLTSIGAKVHTRSSTLSDSNVTQTMRFGSGSSSIPSYMLVPRWIQSGYGVGTNQARVGKLSGNQNICNMTVSTHNSIWSIHGDIVTLQTPKYNGPALRIKFYEGSSNYRLSGKDAGEMLREDWWFVENQGLVRIDVKNFGPLNYFGTHKNLKNNCIYDSDCLKNEVIQEPHVTLTRSDFL